MSTSKRLINNKLNVSHLHFQVRKFVHVSFASSNAWHDSINHSLLSNNIKGQTNAQIFESINGIFIRDVQINYG